MLLEPLSQEERNFLLSFVTEEQRNFLVQKLKRGRETIFGNFMLSEKVSAIKSTDEIVLLEDEQNAADWKIIKYHDYGFRNQVGKCACGRSLRYEFTVQHSKTLKTITYGKVHLVDFLNLQVRDINEVVNGLMVIDYELDEILRKIRIKDYGYQILDELSNKINIPSDIQEHIDYKVPLLNRQLRWLLKIIRDQEKSRPKASLNVDHLKIYEKVSLLIDERLQQEKNEQQNREQRLVEIVNNQLPIHPTLKEIAYCLVKNGVTSSTEISHLIRTYYDEDKRISRGRLQRPYIYMDVVLACMEYVKQGFLIFDEESSTIDDCIFYIDTQEVLISHEQEEIQITLF